MYEKCCVVDCVSVRRKDVSFHVFPKTEIGLLKWLECINCDNLRSLSYQELRKQYVCQKHFEKRFISSRRTRQRLLPNAYPTLFTASEIASGTPERTKVFSSETVNIAKEHSYSKRLHADHTYCLPVVAEKRAKTYNEIVEKPLVSMMSTCSTSEACKEEMVTSVTHTLNLPSTSRESVAVPIKEVVQTTLHQDNTSVGLNTPSVTKSRRVIYRKNNLTPNCAKLYELFRKSRRQLNFNVRARKALKFSKEKSFLQLTENINPLAKKLMWMQIKQCTKKARGRRFTDNEKLIAMSILKQSPKCYKFLQKIFILPSKYTINKMISKLNIEPGINSQIFDAVKEEVKTWDEKKKICSILFDEVALEAALTYEKHKDLITGFVELKNKTSNFADHALVFMLRGVVHKWQQPLTFYFCRGATAGFELKQIIKEMVAAVANTGLTPIALVCDQGTAFQSALKSLQEDTHREQIIAGGKIDDVITINEQTLSIIYDPPHLLKGLRNNFLTKDILYEQKLAKWSDIVEVYKTDCNHAQMRLLHKLTDEHVIPEKIKKMKVKNCTRVFSKTVAATLSYTAQFSHYADGKEVSTTLKNTSEIVSFFDDLFDSVNGSGTIYSKSSKAKPLRQAVTEKSKHHEFWRQAIKKIEQIRFKDSLGKETCVPSLKNWVVTLKSYQRVWQYLNKKNIKCMRPRYLNSDPIENFFGQVRAYNFRNTDPDCHTFKTTFKSLLITRFIKFHSDSFNCEEDAGVQLLNLKSLFYPQSINTDRRSHSLESSELSNWDKHERLQMTARQERLSVHSQAYTTGWVIRKILNIHNCRLCEKNLASRELSINKYSIHNWISFREFKCLKEKKLTYPSEHAVRLFGIISQEANEYLQTQPHKNNIIKNIKTLIKSKYSFDFLDCELHKDTVLEYFLTLTLRLIIFNWCNIINKILKGKDLVRLEDKILPPMQLKALNKFKTKLKNKKM